MSRVSEAELRRCASPTARPPASQLELDGWSWMGGWMGGRVDGWVEVPAHPTAALDQARLASCAAVEPASRLATLGREGSHTRAARAAGMHCTCMCGIAMCVYILSAHSTHPTDVTHSTPTPTPTQAAVKQEELAACLTLLQQQQQQQQQQGQAGDASLRATGSNAQPAAPASSNPNPTPSPNTAPKPDPNPNPKQAAPASSWLSTSSSFPRNVLRRVSDALGGSERDLGVN